MSGVDSTFKMIISEKQESDKAFQEQHDSMRMAHETAVEELETEKWAPFKKNVTTTQRKLDEV